MHNVSYVLILIFPIILYTYVFLDFIYVRLLGQNINFSMCVLEMLVH